MREYSDPLSDRIREELGRRRVTRQWLANEARISLSTLEKGLAGQRRIAGITDRDEHVAHEARAPDAFDRAFREQRPEARVIKPREFGKPRCA